MKKKGKLIIDDMRRSFRNDIHKRIKKGKSTLITGEVGSGKTKLLGLIRPKKLTISNVESLGSVNCILLSILQQRKYKFTSKMDKSVEYLHAVCKIKNIAILIDDLDDLRPSVFRYLKRIMNAEIPIVMAGQPEIETIMAERHEDVFCRLKVLNLQPVSVADFKKFLPQFAPDTLEVIFGASFGNMWRFDEICEQCLEETSRLKRKRATMDIVEKFV